MRQALFCFLGFVLLLLALPLAAQPTPQAQLLLDDGTSCPVEADPALLEGTPDLALAEIIGVPAPTRVAVCDSNYCTLAREHCASICAPCSFDFTCKGRICQNTCTCRC